MKIFTRIFCFIILMAFGAKFDSEFDENLNKLLSVVFKCFKKPVGSKCPVGCDCTPYEDSKVECQNATKCCVSTSDPLTLFYLFTPKNKENPEFLHECGGRLPANTLFDKNLDLLVMTHGLFDGSCRTTAWREMKDQFFIRGNYNIILVDWSRENIPDIYDALNANKYVGKRIGCVIRNIMIETGITPDKIHLMGHSMGSHISGFAAKHMKRCGIKPRRITAFDPSNFGYFGYPPDKRLDRDDAECVDAIHTNIGDCFPMFIGYKTNIGHADFYPNGGKFQLSCYPFQIESFLKLDIFSALISLMSSFCYHLQVLQFFKVSINPDNCQFVGVECKDYEEFKRGACRSCGQNGSNCAVMGMDFEKFRKGPCTGSHSYYLTTAMACPYCDNSKIQLNGFPGNSGK